MVETWLKVQESNAESLANDQQIREADGSASGGDAAARLTVTAASLAEPQAAAPTPPNLAALNARLAQELGPGMSSHEFVTLLRGQQAAEGPRLFQRRADRAESRCSTRPF